MNPDTTQNPDRLPPRGLPRRRSGRHRDPLSFDSWVGTPTLVLAVPGSADADAREAAEAGAEEGTGSLGRRMADLVRTHRPEVTIRFGYTEGEEAGLTEALADLEPQEGRAVRAVVVPLVADAHPPTLEAVHAAVAATGADVRVTEGLGPHPMLAEALHLRLAEAGFVRADRMRLISVAAMGTGMADGVVVGCVGGAESVNVAGVTAVLLAARLGVTVLPAALDDPASLSEVFGQIEAAGCARPVIARASSAARSPVPTSPHWPAGSGPASAPRSAPPARWPRSSPCATPRSSTRSGSRNRPRWRTSRPPSAPGTARRTDPAGSGAAPFAPPPPL